MKIRHQVIFHGATRDKVILEQFVEWKITEEELQEPIKQLGIMEWEDENLIKPYIEVKRQSLTDEEWDELQKPNAKSEEEELDEIQEWMSLHSNHRIIAKRIYEAEKQQKLKNYERSSKRKG